MILISIESIVHIYFLYEERIQVMTIDSIENKNKKIMYFCSRFKEKIMKYIKLAKNSLLEFVR